MIYTKDNISFVPQPTHSLFIDRTGEIYLRLTVIGYAGKLGKSGKIQMWWCECECGNVKKVSQGNLKTGHIQSCGCLRDEKIGALNRTHGMANHPAYNVWLNMRRRCHDTAYPKYQSYGARGITVCERWRTSFENFLEDMGERPSLKHSIERLDNNGNYEPTNCIWTDDLLVQANNTRSNHLLVLNDKSQTIAQWARELEMPYSTLMARIRRGWSDERTLTTPLQSS